MAILNIMFLWVVTNKHVIRKSVNKYPDEYDWLYPVPGDWHIMKTAAEVLKMVLNDGGFKVFAAKYGHKGDISGKIFITYYWQPTRL